MSSFELIESSQEQGAPIELYEFIYGSTSAARYRYTNADEDFPFGNETFYAVPIKRDNYHSAGKTDKHSLNIRLPVTTDLAALFTEYPPTQPVAVIIYQGHLTDPEEEFVAVWSGRCLSASKEGHEQVLTCESTIVSLKRPGLRRNYQYGCPYVLYGSGCNANEAAATFPAEVLGIDNGRLVLQAAWYGQQDVNDFVGGMIKWQSDKGTEARTILKIENGEALVLIGPARGIEPGDTVDVIKGCNHRVDGCRKHNNILNYGGQPWIPTKNPTKYHPFW